MGGGREGEERKQDGTDPPWSLGGRRVVSNSWPNLHLAATCPVAGFHGTLVSLPFCERSGVALVLSKLLELCPLLSWILGLSPGTSACQASSPSLRHTAALSQSFTMLFFSGSETGLCSHPSSSSLSHPQACPYSNLEKDPALRDSCQGFLLCSPSLSSLRFWGHSPS